MPWIRFFLAGVTSQAKDAEERTVRLVELQHRMRNDLLAEGRPNSVIRLAEHLVGFPLVTAKSIAASLAVSKPTAHNAIDTLVERGDLVEMTGRERGRVFEAPGIFDIAFGDVPPEEPEAGQLRLG